MTKGAASSSTRRPPDRNGLSASVVALPPGIWPTILDFLVVRFPAIDRDEWCSRMQHGEVLDEQGQAIATDTAYRANGKVFYYRHIVNEPLIPFRETVLFQDEHIVVADKPHFLPVVPTGRFVNETLLVRLKQALGIETLAPMHRIDRDTAGLVLFTVQPGERDAYQRMFRERRVDKTYEAVAPLRDDLSYPFTYCSRLVESDAFMQMREVAGQPNAETTIELVRSFPDTPLRGTNLALYRLQPRTGQKHQLRAHMAALGMPICNDRIYPTLLADDADQPDYSHPLQLLAKRVAFIDPVTSVERVFESHQLLHEILSDKGVGAK